MTMTYEQKRGVVLDASPETLERYLDYRAEGYTPIQARLMSGMTEPEMEGMYHDDPED